MPRLFVCFDEFALMMLDAGHVGNGINRLGESSGSVRDEKSGERERGEGAEEVLLLSAGQMEQGGCVG